MRLAPLLALLLAAPALHAQADPNPPEAYYPLHVGDQWEYQEFAAPNPFPPTYPYQRSTVISDTVAGGRRYFIVRSQSFTRQNGALSVSQYRSVVRFDTATASVRVLQNGGTTEGTVLPCRLDLPIPPAGGSAPCSGATPPTYSVAPDTTVAIGGSIVTTSLRGFVQAGFHTTRYAAGIGYLGSEGCEIGCSDLRLVYARVDGAEYGQKLGIGFEPDLTPAEAYAPLAVGNQWEYLTRDVSMSGVIRYRRETVVRDTLIGGVTWQIRRNQSFSLISPRTVEEDSESLLRFDPATANVIYRAPTGATQSAYFCRLDVALTGDAGGICGVAVQYTKRLETVLPGTTATTLTLPQAFGTVRIAAGLGLVSSSAEQFETELVYARIGGQTFGTRVDGLPSRPDLTPPADYYPLEVGNEWIYHYTENSVYGVSDTYERRRVLREETVDGQVYAVDQTCTLNRLDAAPAWNCGTERRLRFDPATTDIVQSIAPGVSRVLFCRLGADFGALLPDGCDGAAYVEAPTSIQIGSASYGVPSSKRLATLANVAPAAFLAGIGPAERPVGEFQTSSFEFARVRGVEYGQRPVAGEAAADPAAALVLAASPNPTTGALRLAITLPEAQIVRLEAFDALGRRVWQLSAALGAGAQSVPVDASGWAPGVYVVRASAGSAAASARVVRR